MELNLEKLESVRDRGDKTTARCPACAKEGHDKKGDHLVIYPDGKFTCIKYDSKEHRQEIFRLVGNGAGSGGGTYPKLDIRRPKCDTPKPKLIRQVVFPERAVMATAAGAGSE